MTYSGHLSTSFPLLRGRCGGEIFSWIFGITLFIGQECLVGRWICGVGLVGLYATDLNNLLQDDVAYSGNNASKMLATSTR